MKSNMANILLDEDPLEIPATRLASNLVETSYFLSTGRDLSYDSARLTEGLNYATKTLAEPMGATRLGYEFLTGRKVEDDLKNGWEYAKSLPQDIATCFLGYLGNWIFGSQETNVDEGLIGLARKALSDEIDFEIETQEQLQKRSQGKYSDKHIYGLCDNGKIILGRETAADEGLKYRTLLHEALESASHRTDSSNDEHEHSEIELKVIAGLEYAAKNFTGKLREKAEKARESFYKSVYEGSQAGDDLMTKVKSMLSGADLN